MKLLWTSLISAAIWLTTTLAWGINWDIPVIGRVCDTCGGGLLGGAKGGILGGAKDFVEKFGTEVFRATEKLGDSTLTTIRNAQGDTIKVLEAAGGDAFATFQKAGGDSLRTVFKAAGDVTVTYVKGWRDIGEQGRQSFSDAVDAGQAALHFAENQAKAQRDAFGNAEKRAREGKVIDSMWGLATEPLQSSEENFSKATQESEVINAAAGSAAAVYGGPAGAAAYASWSTYRRTGNAEKAFRAGLLAGVTAQIGSAVAKMPAGTAGEIIKKASIAGAAGGISVAAAGGDEQSIKEGFLKSAGAVLIQGGSDKFKAYSPQAKDAYDTIQCVSARDVDCISNTTWARDAKGKIRYDANGNPRIDSSKLDPNLYTGKWTRIDPLSDAGKKYAFITQTSKLPKMEAIPLQRNQWVLTWTLGQGQDIAYNKPTVVLTYVGNDTPFVSEIEYGQISRPALQTPVIYYKKDADGNGVFNALRGLSLSLDVQPPILPNQWPNDTVACGPNTPVEAIKAIANALLDGGIPLRGVYPLGSTNNIIYILTTKDLLGKHVESEPLSREDLTALTGCPVNEFFKYRTFKKPQPKSYPGEGHYMSAWYRTSPNKIGGAEAAEYFCWQMGMHGVIDFNYGKTTLSTDVVVQDGDYKIYSGKNIYFFDTIVCH